MDIKLRKVKLKFQSKDLKRTFSICWCRLFSISPAASRYPWHWAASHSRTAAPLDAEASRVQRLPHYHLPTEARVPFNKLTRAPGLQNNKQKHGVVFVKDKGLRFSLMLLRGLGRHSNHLPQMFSVPWTFSHIALIWGFHFDTGCFGWQLSFEETRTVLRFCWFLLTHFMFPQLHFT